MSFESSNTPPVPSNENIIAKVADQMKEFEGLEENLKSVPDASVDVNAMSFEHSKVPDEADVEARDKAISPHGFEELE